MKEKKLPDDIYKTVMDWNEEFAIVHFWEMEGTYFVIAKDCDTHDIYFLRLWRSIFTNSVQLSQDNVMYD